MERAIKLLEDKLHKLDSQNWALGQETGFKSLNVDIECNELRKAIKLLSESQNISTSDEALPTADVVKRK
jgi:hypothetical protein